ncbi:MAG: hypothetical protein WAR24_12685, partial [Candidatus Acidiferrales bacterium]
MATEMSKSYTTFPKVVRSDSGPKDLAGGQGGLDRTSERVEPNGSGIGVPGIADLHPAEPNHVRCSGNGSFDSAKRPNEPGAAPGPGSTGSAAGEITEVDFAELEDGTLVELVEDPTNPSRTLLAVWEDGTMRYLDRWEHNGRVFVPLPRENEILRRVRLPNAVGPYGSVQTLLSGIEDLISQCVDVDPKYVPVLASFVLSTWFVDRFSVAPYLSLVGLPQSGKTTLLRVLSLVCRRPLLVADITSASFYRACAQFVPTILIDEAGTVRNSRELRHLLRTGTTRDVMAVRKNQTFHAYGAKVISWLEPPDDTALNSRCIQIPMFETFSTNLVRPGDPEAERLAAGLQAQLLQFRFENYRKVRPGPIPGDEILRPRTRDLLWALAAAHAQDVQRSELLLKFFESGQAVPQEPLTPEQNAVLCALFSMIHVRGNISSIRTGDLTVSVNWFLKKAGESLQLLPRKVGAVLASLGFLARSRTNVGWNISVNRGDVVKLHHLAR